MNIKHKVFPIKLLEKGYFDVIENKDDLFIDDYKKILNSYYKNPSDYKMKYIKLLLKKRLAERIKIKFSLFVYLLKINFREKLQLIRNIVNYYFVRL